MSRILRRAVLIVLVSTGVNYAKKTFRQPSNVEARNSTNGLPNQSVLINRLSIAVTNTFRNATDEFNPSGVPPPIFQIYDQSFLDVLGPSPSIRLIAENDAFNFAHEAPIWFPPTDDFFFCSNAGTPPTSVDVNNQVSTFSLKEAAVKSTVTVTKLNITPELEMTNGGTLFREQLLFINSGRGDRPPSIAFVNPRAPHNSTVILNNFFGRQFNSLNDIKIHPKSKAIFFTDTVYGFLNHFRPVPAMPNQVYRFDPNNGELRVVADGFDKSNGIAFTADGKTAYIADTGASQGFMGNNFTRPATIYQFDVDVTSQTFLNRRVFAYVDTGVPDGLELDTKGNVYAGTGDGVEVFNPQGVLIGKVFLGTTSANMAFAGKGRLVVLAETKIFLVNFAAEGMSLDFGP